MEERVLRRNHRYLGITLVFFLFIQGGSGLLISVNELFNPPSTIDSQEMQDHSHGNPPDRPDVSTENKLSKQEHGRHGFLGRFHHSKAAAWSLYRIIIGSGLMAMLFSGTTIFIKTQSRSRKIIPK
ncbi:MAG: hypothetical protein KKD63_08825 [Proteobacteria bacterium]|nr:hypothetical protein [Desulfobulbaceae bacterium]MBU4152971.1 hypothetical protein [Pseudomonadota bacterium]